MRSVIVQSSGRTEPIDGVLDSPTMRRPVVIQHVDHARREIVAESDWTEIPQRVRALLDVPVRYILPSVFRIQQPCSGSFVRHSVLIYHLCFVQGNRVLTSDAIKGVSDGLNNRFPQSFAVRHSVLNLLLRYVPNTYPFAFTAAATRSAMACNWAAEAARRARIVSVVSCMRCTRCCSLRPVASRA